MKDINQRKLFIIFSIICLILLIFGFLFWQNKNFNNQSVFCTKEAKICPDGSAVGREGPNCEFAPCP